MPSVPMLMPSETPTVKKRMPTRSAAWTEARTRVARPPRCMLQGLPS
jgi:hypothetical protein